VPKGVQVVFCGHRDGTDGWMSQVLPEVLAPGTRYTLRVEVGRRLNMLPMAYVIQLLAGDEVVAEDTNSLSPTPGTFETSTITFIALPGDARIGEPLKISLGASGPTQTSFDDHDLKRLMGHSNFATTEAFYLGDSEGLGAKVADAFAAVA